MTTEIKTKARRQMRRMSYNAAARELGVDVGHLWRVVHGERQSKRLTARLRAANIQLGGK